ncbi:MAG TPA: arginine deiminase-related protein [Dermatophilaceae bacterium]|nr:arginine deiminase-related protein [Dermatophilaceae bacterium]
MTITLPLAPGQGDAPSRPPVPAPVPAPARAPTPASVQAPASVVMVRPHHFAPDARLCRDNGFTTRAHGTASEVARAAHAEVSAMAERLAGAGVRVHLFEDASSATPDSVFPNNWFSTHDCGSLVLYPMRARTRRGERRRDVVDALAREYAVATVRDYSRAERTGRYLEGTGSMVLDHVARVAYVCRSRRVSAAVLRRFCADHGYRAVVVDAVDRAGRPIYHTNVMMSVGTDLALVCLEAVRDASARRALREELDGSGHEVVPLTLAQVGEFAGNALELTGSTDRVLVMSARGWASLDAAQRRVVGAHVDVLPVHVPTVEHAGGSARCMVAGVHLPSRSR